MGCSIKITLFREEGAVKQEKPPLGRYDAESGDISKIIYQKSGLRSCSISPQKLTKQGLQEPEKEKKYSFHFQEKILDKKAVKKILVLDKPTKKIYWDGKPKSYDHTRFNVFFRRMLRPFRTAMVPIRDKKMP